MTSDTYQLSLQAKWVISFMIVLSYATLKGKNILWSTCLINCKPHTWWIYFLYIPAVFINLKKTKTKKPTNKKLPKSKQNNFCIKMPPFIMILNKHKRLKSPV